MTSCSVSVRARSMFSLLFRAREISLFPKFFMLSLKLVVEEDFGSRIVVVT